MGDFQEMPSAEIKSDLASLIEVRCRNKEKLLASFEKDGRIKCRYYPKSKDEEGDKDYRLELFPNDQHHYDEGRGVIGDFYDGIFVKEVDGVQQHQLDFNCYAEESIRKAAESALKRFLNI